MAFDASLFKRVILASMRFCALVIMPMLLLHTAISYSRYISKKFSVLSYKSRPLARRGGIGLRFDIINPGSVVSRCVNTQSGIDYGSSENLAIPSVNLKGLRSEVDRGVYRTHKKLTKANERLGKLRLKTESDNDEQHEVEQIIAGLEEHLLELRDIDTKLKEVHSKNDASLPSLVARATELGISDTPKPLPERGAKKAKGRPAAPRLPYFTYTSLDGIDIRVGRASKDNDLLSCNAEYRDSSDWWLHVSGCPGSHIIIRSHDDDLQSGAPQTVIDAAVLAVANSKAASVKGRVKVNLTRARNVSKPVGAKPGLVRLSGDIYTVSVNVKAEAQRLERLIETKR